ncbi:hypothetical protein RB614_40340 [Phytohabitans sp. ZYX-F-186]|uniref:Helix-turn-helix domain-containing protein n=1 Tax=Phytohabitans maris TaxID=3071409 RepID=A0ABU0ZUP5_9ACTN|nr:hypothetical protein [Phytohabitans sp. ZYX-F-186]MDQ7910759.1 hypothetical protein [Phytohabitans sp. ZYX-F-186]
MAYQLVAEVLDHAPPMTPAERLLLVAIAEQVRLPSRTRPIATEDLVRRVGIEERGVRAALRRLAERGLDVRVVRGTDSRGLPVYATRGTLPQYRLPELPVPPGCSCAACGDGGTVAPPALAYGGTVVPPSRPDGGTPMPDGGTVVTDGGTVVYPIGNHGAAPTVPTPGSVRARARARDSSAPLPGSLVQRELAARRVEAAAQRSVPPWQAELAEREVPAHIAAARARRGAEEARRALAAAREEPA